jgi:hypothetical protein
MSPSLKTYRVYCYDAGNRIITNSWVEASKCLHAPVSQCGGTIHSMERANAGLRPAAAAPPADDRDARAALGTGPLARRGGGRALFALFLLGLAGFFVGPHLTLGHGDCLP